MRVVFFLVMEDPSSADSFSYIQQDTKLLSMTVVLFLVVEDSADP